MAISYYATPDVIIKMLNGDFDSVLGKLEKFSEKDESGISIFNEDERQLVSFMLGIATTLSWQEKLDKKTVEDISLRLVKMGNIFAFMEEVLKQTNAWQFDERFRYRNFIYRTIPFDICYALRSNNPEEGRVLEEIEGFDAELLKTLLVFLLDSEHIETLSVKFFEPIVRAILKTELISDYQVLICLFKTQI